ncbi:SDR family oxidoreductase, partial [Patulibacter sp. S7RM1-6]
AARPGVRERLASYTAIAGPSLDLAARPRGGGADPARTARQALKSWYIAAFHLPLLAPLTWRLWAGAHWRTLFARTEGQPPPPGHPAPTIVEDAVTGIRLYRRNVLERFLRPRYDRIDLPLVQVGVTLRDAFLAPHLYDDLPGRMPELWVRRADATHWLPLLHPELAARWIREAVAAVEDGAAPPADAAVHREGPTRD